MKSHSMSVLLYAVVLFVAFLIRIPSLHNNFVFDDADQTIYSSVVVSDSMTDALLSYRPVRTVSYWVDYHLIGHTPAAFRGMNIFYHLLTILMLIVLVRKMSGSDVAALTASLLFALHPIHSDAVIYISGRRDILTALFYLTGLYAFIRGYEAQTGSGRPWWFAGAAISFILSYFSKETGITLPLVWLLYVWFKEGNKIFSTLWFNALSLGGITVVAILALYTVQEGASSFISFHSIRFHGGSASVHYLTALTLPLYYLTQTLFPIRLVMDNINYPLVDHLSIRLFVSLTAIIAYIAVVFLLFVRARKTGTRSGSRYRQIGFFMIFFAVTLLPMLQIIPLHEIVAEHYLYLSSVAFCAIAGIGADWAWMKIAAYKQHVRESGGDIPVNSRLLLTAYSLLFVVALFSVFFARRTFSRNFEMKNWFTILHEEMKNGELSYRGYYTLASEYMALGFPEEAKKLLDKSEQTGVTDMNYYNARLQWFLRQGLIRQGLDYYEKVRKQTVLAPMTHIDAATAYFIQGNCSAVNRIVSMLNPENEREKQELRFLRQCVQPADPDFSACEKEGLTRVACVIRQAKTARTPLEAYLLLRRYMSLNDSTITITMISLLKGLGKMRVGAIPLYKKAISQLVDEKQKLELKKEYAVMMMKVDVPRAITLYREINETLQRHFGVVDRNIVSLIQLLQRYQKEVVAEKRYARLPL